MNSIKISLAYRAHTFTVAISNGVHIVLLYFLWRAIFENSEATMRGLTFHQTFLYVSLASVIHSLFRNFVEWFMTYEIRSGDIVVSMLKPYDYQLSFLFQTIGYTIFSLVLVTAPTTAVLVVLFKGYIALGTNLIYFFFSLIAAFLLNFCLDFMTGTTSFYTESIWGISEAKRAIVLFLSGAVIPFEFFPLPVQRVLQLLPFQAIYNTPLSILLQTERIGSSAITMIAVQLFWVVVFWILSRIYFKSAQTVLTVNGG